MAINPVIAGAAISGAASLAGSFIGASSQSEANDAMLANAAKDRQLQRNFAKKGIRWRVKDAQAAGIHPLYAMGASLPTYSPSGINIGAKRSGGGLAAAGQDIGRAVAATATQPERDLQIARAALENKYLEAQILKLTRENQTGPPFPSAMDAPGGIPGQGSFPGRHPGVQVLPRQITATAPDTPSRAAGTVPAISFMRNQDNSLSIVPSPGAKELIEDQIIPEAQWAYRNLVTPLWNRDRMKEIAKRIHVDHPNRPGYYWDWHTASQTFREFPLKSRRIGPPSGHIYKHRKAPASVWGDTFTGG